MTKKRKLSDKKWKPILKSDISWNNTNTISLNITLCPDGGGGGGGGEEEEEED